MKKQLLLLAVPLVFTLCGAENLIKNGDFAQQGGQWKSPQYTGGKKFHTFADGALTVSGNEKSVYNSFATLIQDLPQLDRSQEYIISADVAANVPVKGTKTLKISVRQADGNDKTIVYSGFDIDLSAKNSKKYTARFRPAINAAKFRVYVTSSNFADSDLVTVDNISLTAIPNKGGTDINLVQNGDFESVSLAPWASRVGKAQTAPFAVKKEAAGNVLSVNGDPANKYANFLTLIQQLPPLQPGKKYQLSFRAKAGLNNIAGKYVAVQIRESDMDNVTIVYGGISRIDLAGKEWKTYKATIIPRIEADKFELYVVSSALAQGDTVLLDDISVVQLP